MSSDTPKSIFDYAGQSPAPKKKKKPVATTEKTAAPEPSIEEEPIVQKGHVPSDSEIEQMFSQMKSWQIELADKLEKAYNDGKISPDKIEKLLNLMGEATMMKLKERQEKLQTDIYAALGKGSKERTERRKEVKRTKKQRGKTIGERKGWISMS